MIAGATGDSLDNGDSKYEGKNLYENEDKKNKRCLKFCDRREHTLAM
jgi:hypothetical protein